MTSMSLFATGTAGAGPAAPHQLPIEELLLPLLIQLAIIILVARIFAAMFLRLGQPGVVGEIAAGLVLGPSLLGWLCPGVFQAIFHPGVPDMPLAESDRLLGWALTSLSQLGLVLLLFLIGLEFDFSHLRWHGKSALAISAAGMALPFVLGLGLAEVMRPYVGEVPPLGFALFLGTALSITAVPILGRMMMELNITRTRLGAITIAAAAADDAVGWILLAAVAAIVRAQFELGDTLIMAAETIGFAVLMVVVARPALRIWVRYALRRGDGELGVDALAVLLALIFGCAVVTSLIGIFAVFGAFFLGAVLSGEHEFRQAVARRLRDFVTAFFLPLFFAYTGLRTNIGSLESGQLWLLCGLVSATAILAKFGGCGLAAWLTGFRLREAACIGALMNTRALMALIVINLGKDLGVVPDSVFCMLIVMALLTTVMTTPVLLRLMHGTELEPYILRSHFARRPPPRKEPPALAETAEAH
ncbi:MAG: cation:proton antiporter [Gemmataceae bacterium]|nr:cation:proton antiporter [Gemmataceae bacterium]